ncbi:glycosyltransferase family 2 protein [Pedobacter sp.]|nr:glycosyltransferase family 2 protein [Candidatus Saccharibacteria bacterium]
MKHSLPSVAIIVPAYNEEEQIAATLDSLLSQTSRADRIIVVCNNCTDSTVDIVRAYAADDIELIEMPHNPYKKAGALNAGIRRLFSSDQNLVTDYDFVLTIDGDTILDQHFIERCLKIMTRKRELGGVSATCIGKSIEAQTLWQKMILLMQKIEYSRYAVMRIRVDVHTMSGAGSFYRATALNQLLSERLNIFDERNTNLVEDFATTLDLKDLGWKITTNEKCVAFTDLMPTVRQLLRQRERWVRGTTDELRARGWRASTWKSIIQLQLAILGLVVPLIWVGLITWQVSRDDFHPNALWLLWIGFWCCYQAFAVRKLGFKVMLFEAALLPEMFFGLLRQYWLIKSVFMSYRSRAQAWE